MRSDQWFLGIIILVFLLGVFVWSLCMAVKFDLLEAERDKTQQERRFILEEGSDA